MKYKLQSKYPTYYKELEDALEFYAEEHDLYGYKYNEIASHVIDFCNRTFSYIDNHQERITYFLQGLGLAIPYTHYDIEQMAIKDGHLEENASENRYIRIIDGYWSTMAMRLINISGSKTK